jgi:uncharacterized membrane protein
VYWLARKHLGYQRAGIGFALVYLVYPPTTWLALNEFHPGGLAMPALLYAFWYLDEDRLCAFAAFALFASICREDVPLVLAGFGVWYALAKGRAPRVRSSRSRGSRGRRLRPASCVPHFGAGQSTFSGRYSEARAALDDPVALFRLMFDHAGVQYLLDLVLPLAGLCLLSPLRSRAAPALLLNLLSATPTQTSIHFHYTAAEIPPLIAAAVLGGARVRRPVASAGGDGRARRGAGRQLRARRDPGLERVARGETLQARAAVVSEHDRVAARALKMIPPKRVVSATNSLGAHLSARRAS